MTMIQGVDAMSSEAARFIGDLSPRTAGATVIALSGDLDTGKTTFAQGIARALGVRETVASPTFVIEKVYEITNQRWTHLIHIDAYRLKDAYELEVLGWREMARESGNLIVIEWPEMVAELIPKDAICVTLGGDGDMRIVSYGIQNTKSC